MQRERVIDPGISVVTDRLAVDGVLSEDCGQAIFQMVQERLMENLLIPLE